MRHIRGKPYHPMTQGKIERWHLSFNLTPADVYFGRAARIIDMRKEIKRRTIHQLHLALA